MATSSVAASTSQGPTRTTSYAWYIAGLMCLGQVLAVMDRYLISVVMEPMKRDLALTDTQLGVLQGPAFVAMFLVASLPIGRLTDVAPRRLIIFGGLMFWSLATAASGFAQNYHHLLLARMAVGMGEAALLSSVMSLLVAYFSRDKFNRGVSIYTMGSSLGRVAGFVGGGAALAYFSTRDGLDLGPLGQLAPWQAVFVAAGVLGVLMAFWILVTVREPPRVIIKAERTSMASGLAYMWRHRAAYAALFIPFSMIAGITQLLASWTVSFYVREHGMTSAKAAALIGTTGLLVGPLGHLFGGWFNDRLRNRGDPAPQTLVLAMLMTAIPLLVWFFTLSPTVAMAAGFFGAAYFFTSVAGPSGFAGAQMPTPDRYRGVVSSVFLISYMLLGVGVGPLAVGLLNDSVFQSERMLGPSMAISVGGLCAISVPIAWFGRKAFRAAVLQRDAEGG